MVHFALALQDCSVSMPCSCAIVGAPLQLVIVPYNIVFQPLA